MVLTGSSDAGRSSHRAAQRLARTRDGMLCAQGDGTVPVPRSSLFRSPFRLLHLDFHSSSALNYLYVCNYLFFITMLGG